MDLAGSKRPSYSAAALFSNSDCSGPDRITLGCWQISFSKEAAYFDNGNPTGKLKYSMVTLNQLQHILHSKTPAILI